MGFYVLSSKNRTGTWEAPLAGCVKRGRGYSLNTWDVAFHNDGFQANADATHFSLFFLTDECPEEELTVRLFLRRVFLDPLGTISIFVVFNTSF